jgi:hypothetical protein
MEDIFVEGLALTPYFPYMRICIMLYDVSPRLHYTLT